VAEDDEPTLMLAQSETLSSPNFGQPLKLVTKRLVKLVEEVHAVLGDMGDEDPNRWIFDTRASNHMTSTNEVFTELDTDVICTMQFGDGSMVWMEGCNTILFICKNGKHRTLANTYYILCLTTNMSVVASWMRVGCRSASSEASC
jgi:hypothetical protein